VNAVFATGLLYSFQQADLHGKVIVVILIFGSILTWSVMLTKWTQLRRARRTSEKFLAEFRRNAEPLHLFINNFSVPDCPLYNIYVSGSEEISGRAQSPSGVNFDAVRAALGRAIDREIIRMESQMSILSTAVTGGPFLGLLGAAWGVMSVFGQMGVYGTVRLGAVAPGISAALLATVVGLLVAVPSLFGYNLLGAHIRATTIEMENFASEFLAAVEHRYAKAS
jgi:biopolymer transport protein TolQ